MLFMLNILVPVQTYAANIAEQKINLDSLSTAERELYGISETGNITSVFNSSERSLERSTHYTESESNNSFASANTLALNSQAGSESHMFGTLSSTDNSDYYIITPPRHGRVSVYIYSPSGFTYNVDLYDSSHSAMEYHTSSIGTKSFMAPKGNTTSGTLKNYYIKVSSNTGYSTSTYRLVVFYSLNYQNLNWTYPVVQGNSYISSPLGYRVAFGDYHAGIDIPGSNTDDIISMCDGTIDRAYYSASMGNFVGVISDVVDQYTGNPYFIRYMHLSSYDSNINTGINSGGTQRISAGDALGKMGTTGGNSTGEHLHVEANSMTLFGGIGTTESSLITLINIIDVFEDQINFSGTYY